MQFQIIKYLQSPQIIATFHSRFLNGAVQFQLIFGCSPETVELKLDFIKAAPFFARVIIETNIIALLRERISQLGLPDFANRARLRNEF